MGGSLLFFPFFFSPPLEKLDTRYCEGGGDTCEISPKMREREVVRVKRRTAKKSFTFSDQKLPSRAHIWEVTKEALLSSRKKKKNLPDFFLK